MKRRRRHERRPHHDRWLVSYADFITLLFAFFVVMYSAAQLDKRCAGQLATAIQTAFLQHGSLPDKPSEVGGLAPNGVPSNLPVGNTDDTEFNMLRNKIENALAGEIGAGDVVVRQSGEGLVVSLRGLDSSILARMKSRPVPPEHLRVLPMSCGKRSARFRSKGTRTTFPYIMRDFPRTGTSRRPERPRQFVC